MISRWFLGVQCYDWWSLRQSCPPALEVVTMLEPYGLRIEEWLPGENQHGHTWRRMKWFGGGPMGLGVGIRKFILVDRGEHNIWVPTLPCAAWVSHLEFWTSVPSGQAHHSPVGPSSRAFTLIPYPGVQGFSPSEPGLSLPHMGSFSVPITLLEFHTTVPLYTLVLCTRIYFFSLYTKSPSSFFKITLLNTYWGLAIGQAWF